MIQKGQGKCVLNLFGIAEHNFFDSQPIKDADVYMLKFIIHDWSNKYSQIILRRLREAAGAHNRLVIVDKIIPYIYPPSELSDDDSITGVLKPEFPEPIANMSGGIIYPHLSGVVVRAINLIQL